MKKVWFITGVSSGFGLEITRQALARGDVVAGTVRRSETTDALAKSYPETFLRFTLDVRDREALKRAVADAAEQFGRIDVLVNNAGYGLFGAAEELSDEEIDAVIGTNLTGSITAIRAVLPVMQSRGMYLVAQGSAPTASQGIALLTYTLSGDALQAKQNYAIAEYYVRRIHPTQS